MGLLVVLIAMIFFVIFALGVWLTVSLAGLLVTLVVAGLVGWLADKVVPGDLPYGWIGAVVAGLLGGWLGGWILDDFGPEIGGIALIPAFVGAVILAFIADLVMKQQEPGRR
ncbi:MAG: GlsB/YeaQ/YmgE family stress response membrane protein [Dehalococcoidia bacterium]|nr:GlsB/YeaQ/YmgE family stress response membrane protein [Dehalococcoidia bacterium]